MVKSIKWNQYVIWMAIQSDRTVRTTRFYHFFVTRNVYHVITLGYFLRDPCRQNSAYCERRRNNTDGRKWVLCHWNFRIHGPRSGSRRHGLFSLYEKLRSTIRAAEVSITLFINTFILLHLHEPWITSTLNILISDFNRLNCCLIWSTRISGLSHSARGGWNELERRAMSWLSRTCVTKAS